MFNLLRKVQNMDAADRKNLIAQYRAILEIGDAATEKQVDTLRQLVAALGYDAVKLEADGRAVANRKDASEKAAKLEERENVYREAQRKHAKFTNEVEAAIDELKDKLSRSLAHVHNLEREWGVSRAAVRNLAELEHKNWELFGLETTEIGPAPFGPGNPYSPRTL
jgi:hypothetical protein